ncbi:MAG: GNAT family N-acetyltransferase [Thermoplasmata archaeon]
MEFRTVNITDYDRIIELWDMCGLPYKPLGRDTKEKVSREIKEEQEYWKGFYDDSKLVAVVFGTDDGRKGWINRLAVHPDYRNRGLGTRLVEAMEKEFHSRDIEVIGVLIEGDNPESMKFFEHLGYVDLQIKYYSKRESMDS